MKQFNDNLWTEEQTSGAVFIGFTRRFIEEKLGECFHILQADSKKVKKGEPLLVIETNDGLENLKAPLSGTIIVFNDKARNFPDRLTEEDTILQVVPEGVTIPKSVKVAKPKQIIPDDFDDWLQQPVAPVAQGGFGINPLQVQMNPQQQAAMERLQRMMQAQQEPQAQPAVPPVFRPARQVRRPR